MRNPYIVKALDKREFENSKSEIFHIEMLLEYGRETLEKQISKFNAKNLIVLIIKTLSAFELLEKSGIFHGDIKPQNIVLESENPKIIDFGISKELKEKALLFKKITTFGTKLIGGTLIYILPEVLNKTKNYILNKIDVYC